MIHRVSMGDKVILMDAFFVVKVIGPSLKKTDILFLLKIISWQQGNCPEDIQQRRIGNVWHNNPSNIFLYRRKL